jgi:hypothetical protein
MMIFIAHSAAPTGTFAGSVAKMFGLACSCLDHQADIHALNR